MKKISRLFLNDSFPYYDNMYCVGLLSVNSLKENQEGET